MTAAQMFWDERLLRHDDMELRRELCVGGSEAHNARLPCTPWYIDRLASVDRRDEALELFNNVLGLRNHVGLLSEGIGLKTGELWGNFPQTYSQVGLILSAMRLSRTWEEGLWHVS
jgi:GH15 family glucan-1,4-alpha-glucosidase